MVQWRVPACFVLSLAGIALQFYIFDIEAKMRVTPGYAAACDFGDDYNGIFNFLKGSSCTKVFSSSYAHILSHFGIVEAGSDWDLGLPWFGLAYFLVCLSFPVVRKINGAHNFFMLVGVAAVGFNVYLASILKFV